MSAWMGVRQSVLVAVFVTNLLNFVMQWVARKANDQDISNRIRHTRIYVFLFGLISLLGCNLLQGGIYEAIMAWVIVGSFIFQHYIHFKAVNQRMRGFARLLCIALLFAQCLGTVIQYLA